MGSQAGLEPPLPAWRVHHGWSAPALRSTQSRRPPPVGKLSYLATRDAARRRARALRFRRKRRTRQTHGPRSRASLVLSRSRLGEPGYFDMLAAVESRKPQPFRRPVTRRRYARLDGEGRPLRVWTARITWPGWPSLKSRQAARLAHKTRPCGERINTGCGISSIALSKRSPDRWDERPNPGYPPFSPCA